MVSGTLLGSIDSWAWATAAKAVVAARKTDLKDTMVADDTSDRDVCNEETSDAVSPSGESILVMRCLDRIVLMNGGGEKSEEMRRTGVESR